MTHEYKPLRALDGDTRETVYVGACSCGWESLNYHYDELYAADEFRCHATGARVCVPDPDPLTPRRPHATPPTPMPPRPDLADQGGDPDDAQQAEQLAWDQSFKGFSDETGRVSAEALAIGFLVLATAYFGGHVLVYLLTR